MESCRLQCLAQRLLTTFREAVTVGLEGTMLSAAPTGMAFYYAARFFLQFAWVKGYGYRGSALSTC